MKKIIILIMVVSAVLVGGFFVLNSYIYNEKQAVVAADYREAEVVVEGERVKMDREAAGVGIHYFGNEVRRDFNEDGKDDVVFLLTRDSGGSGTFYYVVAALTAGEGFVGSEAFFLGDRIAPQTTEFRDGMVIVNYADRPPGESFAARPSIGKSVRLILDPVALQFSAFEIIESPSAEENLPPGAYYEYQFPSSYEEMSIVGGSFDIKAKTQSLLGRGVLFTDAWYQSFSGSCCYPSGLCTFAIVPPRMMVRLEQEDGNMEAMNFILNNEPRPFTACRPNVQHYEVRVVEN